MVRNRIPRICFGDFKGSYLKDKNNVSATKSLCGLIPLDPNAHYGVVSYHLPKLPCAATPVDASTCIAFDKCGTISFVMNLGTIACVASVIGSATGIIPLAASFADAVSSIGMGFSLHGRFYQKLNLMNYTNGKLSKEKVSVRGHVYFQVGFKLPTDWMQIGPIDLSKIVAYTANFLYMLDMGDVVGTIKSVIKDIKNANKGTAERVIKKVLNLGREVSMTINGVCTIKLVKLTHGILNDWKFSFAGVSALLTRGKGSSGLKAGFYMTLSNNLVPDMINSIAGMFAHLGGILSKFGLKPNFKVPSFGTTLAFFVNADALGFKVSILNISLYCMYRFSDKDFSCKLNAEIFTMLMDGAKFVLRKAKEFFDKSGRVVKKLARKAFKAAGKEISKGVKAAVGTIKDAHGHIMRIGGRAFDAFKSIEIDRYTDALSDAANKAAKKAAKLAKMAAEKAAAFARKHAMHVKRKAEEAARKAKQIAENIARDAKRTADKLAKKAKKFFCSFFC